VILAVGLTPAWQQILLFDQFQPGEVNRADEVHWCASGKVLNVGMALHRLGSPSKTLVLVGGRGGEEIRREFTELGIEACWTDTQTPTRVCTTIIDRATGATTELVENSRQPSGEELTALNAAYATVVTSADIVVLSGSLPAGVSTSFYRDLLRRTRCRAILDIRGPELLQSLERRPFLVKPNREELERTLGLDLSEECNLIEAMQQLNRCGAEWVVVTDGSRSVHVSSDQGLYRAVPPTEPVVNPIGCGDSLAAGIAVALSEGQLPLDAIRFGMAAATDNLHQLLPARLDRARVETIAARIQFDSV